MVKDALSNCSMKMMDPEKLATAAKAWRNHYVSNIVRKKMN